jgi:glycine dehydrogenase subunit 2
MDEAVEVFRNLYKMAYENPQALHDAPVKTPVRRLDEVKAARTPVLKYEF